MRMSEQFPNGVKGLRMLLLESVQLTPACSIRCTGTTPRSTLWCWWRPMR